jgi:hypothetical protein
MEMDGRRAIARFRPKQVLFPGVYLLGANWKVACRSRTGLTFKPYQGEEHAGGGTSTEATANQAITVREKEGSD